jgi:carbonic anhydrase
MEKLVSGIHNFQCNIFRSNKEFFERLVGGQQPHTLFITCSDSRMVPDLITQANPGELFVARNVGNIVPPHGSGSGAEAAAIEYAIRALGVKDIIICGHTRCGAVQGMLYPEKLCDLPRVKAWVSLADTCAEIVRSNYANLEGEAKWKVAVEENVLVQLENLRTHPSVAVGLANGSLKLHGWVYKMETGQIFTYDPQSGQYVPLIRETGEPVISPISRDTPHHGESQLKATLAGGITDSQPVRP